MCNNTYAQLVSCDKDKVKRRLIERIENGKDVSVQIDKPDNATFEERILLSGSYMMEINAKILAYVKTMGRVLQIGSDVRYLCNKNDYLTNELPGMWDIVHKVSKGEAEKSEIEKLSRFLKDIPLNKRICIFAAIVGLGIRIDLILGLLWLIMRCIS